MCIYFYKLYFSSDFRQVDWNDHYCGSLRRDHELCCGIFVAVYLSWLSRGCFRSGTTQSVVLASHMSVEKQEAKFDYYTESIEMSKHVILTTAEVMIKLDPIPNNACEWNFVLILWRENSFSSSWNLSMSDSVRFRQSISASW